MGQRCPGVSGVLEGVPSRFQEQAFLGINNGGLFRWHPEEHRVKELDALDETTSVAIGTARLGCTVDK